MNMGGLIGGLAVPGSMGGMAIGSALGGRRKRRTNYVTDWSMAPQSGSDQNYQMNMSKAPAMGQQDFSQDPMQSAIARRLRVQSKGGMY